MTFLSSKNIPVCQQPIAHPFLPHAGEVEGPQFPPMASSWPRSRECSLPDLEFVALYQARGEASRNGYSGPREPESRGAACTQTQETGFPCGWQATPHCSDHSNRKSYDKEKEYRDSESRAVPCVTSQKSTFEVGQMHDLFDRFGAVCDLGLMNIQSSFTHCYQGLLISCDNIACLKQVIKMAVLIIC